MMNCDTVTKESLVITGKRGIIVGGITRAAYGITVHTLGNTAELPTVLDVGVTESYYRMYNEVEKSISKLKAEIRIFEEGKIKLEKVFPQEQLEEMSLFQTDRI